MDFLCKAAILCCIVVSAEVTTKTDRLGWDLPGSPFPADDALACEEMCQRQPRCVAWAFTHENCQSPRTAKVLPRGPGCRLKEGLAGLQHSPCSDSGWVPERMTDVCQRDAFDSWHTRYDGLTPFSRSPVIKSLLLAPNCSISYARADTEYCSWAADETLRCLFMDGYVNDVKVHGHPRNSSIATWGFVTVRGDHPFSLTFHNAGAISGEFPSDGKHDDGRFPSSNVYLDGVWYTSSVLRTDSSPEILDCAGHCIMGPLLSFAVSKDDGKTWRDPRFRVAGERDNLFKQDPGVRLGKGVKFGEMHVVDLGKNQEHNDGFVYLIGHGVDSARRDSDWGLWNQGDSVYMARVRLAPDTVNDVTAWQFWAGDQWISGEEGVSAAVPLFTWIARVGSVSMTYVPSLRRYLTVYTTPHVKRRPMGSSDFVMLDSPSLTGPFTLVDVWPSFGPTAYFPTIPSKFIGEFEGGRLPLWLGFSTLNTYKRFGDPPFTAYAWNLLSLHLVLHDHESQAHVVATDPFPRQMLVLVLLVLSVPIAYALWTRSCQRKSTFRNSD